MTTPELTFNEDAHTYYLGKQRIPGVTEILDSLGLIPHFAKNEAAALRGTIVHKACHYLALGKLDWSTVDPRLIGRVLAYERFLKEHQFEPELLEWRGWNRDYLYAGTLDLKGKMKRGKIIADIKTGAPLKYHKLQTAAYAGFFPGHVPRATLFLYDDEQYKLQFHHDRTDWANFLSCLFVFKIRQENNVTNVL